MVRGGDDQLGACQDGSEGALEVRPLTNAHAVTNKAVIGQDPVVRVRAVGALDVLLKRATQGSVDDLHPAANPQERGTRTNGVLN